MEVASSDNEEVGFVTVKVFILGRPGCGKSTAARRLARLAQHKGWTPVRLNDYHILHEMFRRERYQLDNSQKKFRPTEHNGFDVVDFSVLDEALGEVVSRAQKHAEDSSSKQKIILIEFARDDYGDALNLFHPEFLRDAYFLFVDTDIDTCIERVIARSNHPQSIDDHFVSEKIIRSYYHRDATPQMISQIQRTYNLNDEHVRFIHNTGAWNDFFRDISEFSTPLFTQACSTFRKTGPLLRHFSTLSRAMNCPVLV